MNNQSNVYQLVHNKNDKKTYFFLDEELNEINVDTDLDTTKHEKITTSSHVVDLADSVLINKCCYCDNDCDIASQSCGRCVRNKN